MNTIQELEQRLGMARERLNRACQAMAPKHKGGEWEEYWAAEQEVLLLERQVASVNGDEYAEPLDFPVKWDTGAPMPQLFVNDYRTLLAFLIHEPDPNWDGSYVTIKSAASEEADALALVEFEHCVSAKMGDPNDEVFEGHPLNGKGLEAAHQPFDVLPSRVFPHGWHLIALATMAVQSQSTCRSSKRLGRRQG